jgi:hypothetical protein
MTPRSRLRPSRSLPDRSINSRFHSRIAPSTLAITSRPLDQLPVPLPHRTISSRRNGVASATAVSLSGPANVDHALVALESASGTGRHRSLSTGCPGIFWIRELRAPDPGVEPGVDNCTIWRMSQRFPVPDGHRPATAAPTPTHDSPQLPTVVLPTTRPPLTVGAARAMLRIVLAAGKKEACQSNGGPQSMATANDTLRGR